MKDNHNTNEKTMDKLKKSFEYDIEKNIRFQCLIGKTEATLGITIEPDPHGDGKGTHAHFHATLLCPNAKVIVDIPEPDRCRITNRTCPFIASFGSYRREPELRKRDYAHTIIQTVAFVELYGSQLVNKILATKRLPPIQTNLRLVELNRLMILSGLIDKKSFEKINQLRKIRNKLAHNPKGYLKFSEKKLFELSMDAREISHVIGEKLLMFKNPTG